VLVPGRIYHPPRGTVEPSGTGPGRRVPSSPEMATASVIQ
jgi:hypothetical protein